MPSRFIDAEGFSCDILEFISLLKKHGVRYVIVGGEAVIYHGYARVTGDVDFFYEPAPKNAHRLFACLLGFWRGRIPGVKTAAELNEPGIILQFGRPPHRIDLMNIIDGVLFPDAWKSRLRVQLKSARGDVPAYYIGLRPLLKNKLASGRLQDLLDSSFLQRKLKAR